MSCPDCHRGQILPGEPKGTTGPDGGYFIGAPYPDASKPKKAVVILTDIFGLGLPNPKLHADHFAEKCNVDVYVPDIFNGYYPAPDDRLKFPALAGTKRPWYEMIVFYLSMISLIPRFYAARDAVVDARFKEWLAKLKNEKGYERIGAIGYCFGGTMVVRLAPLLDSIVCAHPGSFSDEALNNVRSPVTWICAEEDDLFPDKRRLEVEANLAARKDKETAVPYEFQVYKATTHGFASRPALQYPEITKAFEGSRAQTVDWLNKTL